MKRIIGLVFRNRIFPIISIAQDKFTVIVLLILICLVGIETRAQDLDGDGINDVLEQELARKFAPEWRFNWRVPVDQSAQNFHEVAYPSSVERFYKQVVSETGIKPQLEFKTGSWVTTSQILDINNIANMVDQFAHRPASDAFWQEEGNSLKIINYAKWRRTCLSSCELTIRSII